jgi:hypothetical protein
MDHPIQTYNGFLTELPTPKGGGRWVEDPHSVNNIVNQTAGRAPNEFESRLAEALMSIYAEGVVELPDVVAWLNGHASTDSTGAPWNESSLRQQLAESASLLFSAGEPQS